ncbi:MAG: hypothetical protein OXU51_20365 [Candidatus Poribacteria bacterium]|nr:hypothetical protein [Candidatus Poribacteria bacterium]
MSLIRRYLNNTRADYRFNTTYTASEISGRYRFNVQVGGKLSTSAIWVKIPSLVNLAQFSGNWMRVGQTNTHPDNHYVTNEVATALRRLAKDWRKYWNDLPKAERDKYDTSVGTLHINDCSLKLGGLFDINANWSPSHNTHRTGFDTDIRTDKVANSARTGGIPPRVMPNSNFDHKAKFEELVDDAYPGATILHENKGEANPNEHFHIFWIPNRDARRYAGYR